MDTLTLAQIADAQRNDLDAITAVVQATESRVTSLAHDAASRMGTSYGEYLAEFTQTGRVAVWEAIKRFDGTSVDSFYAFIYRTVDTVLMDTMRSERHGGADPDAVKVFASMLDEAEGDVHLAEKLSQTLPPKGKRLGAERAYAARIAWQGSVSIDKTSGDDETSLLHTLAVSDETPNVVRPKVGRGAALEALSVLERYVATPRDAQDRVALLAALENPTTADEVDVIENAVRVPRDAQVRRYVLDAVAILRSYVSTATEGALTDDLRDAADDRKDERAVKHANVSSALDKMSTAQRNALVLSFGIGGAQEYGWGDRSDLEGLAEAMGTTTGSAKKTRSVAKASFAKQYIAIVARTKDEAMAWAGAAAKMLAHGGRK